MALNFSHKSYHACTSSDAGPEALLASIVGPADGEHPRVPLDLVMVVDTSSSMHGSKLELMKQGLRFVVSQMSERDTLSLVEFNTGVSTIMRSSKMTPQAKAAANDKLDTLRARGQTNLSGGLLKGLDEFSSCSDDPSRSGSVMVFTDGISNEGVTDLPQLLRCLEGASAEISRPFSVYTFGFGSDHCADMLRGISDAGQGLYYYLSDPEQIPSSFADCLGGLLSVVAQNVALTVLPGAGCTLQPLITGFPQEVVEAGTKVTIGDINSEESKDLLFWLDLPAATEEEAPVVCTLRLEYFSPGTASSHTTDRDVVLERSPDQALWSLNPEVEEHVVRVRTASAIQKANIAAGAGDLRAANLLLEYRLNTNLVSPAAHCPSVQELNGTIESLAEDFKSAEQYEKVGTKRANSCVQGYLRQKGWCNDTSMKQRMVKRSRDAIPSGEIHQLE